MIASIIAALIGNYMTTCFGIGLLVGLIQVLRACGRQPGRTAGSTFLDAYLLWAVGIAQCVNFVMHSVFGDFAARTIGWAQSPFQFELALASLGFGLMGILLHGRTTQLRAKVALVVSQLVFGLGAAGGHVYQTVVHGDHAVNNSGLLLVMDVVISLTGLAFVLWAAASTPRGDVVDVPAHQSSRRPVRAGR